MDKKSLSERDICTKFITPALRKAGWDEMTQIREEVSFTKGRITVRGKLASRGKGKRADYILYYKPNVPIALIEAKDNTHAIGDGMQQGLDYAETLQDSLRIFLQWRWLRLPRPDRCERREGDHHRPRRLPVARGPVGALSRLEGADTRGRGRRPPGLFRRRRRQGPALLPGQRHQRRHRGDCQGRRPHPAGHGDRHGQDLHRVPDHLAALEGRPQEAHPVPGRSQRAGRPDHGQRLPALRRGDGQAVDEGEDHRTRGRLFRGADRRHRRTAAHRHRLRDLSRPLPGNHRAGGAPEDLSRVLARLLRSHRHRRVPSRQRRRGFSLAGDSGVLLVGHPDRADRHAQGNPLRFQHRLLRPAGVHLFVEAGDSATDSWRPTRSSRSTSIETSRATAPRRGSSTAPATRSRTASTTPGTSTACWCWTSGPSSWPGRSRRS